METKWLRESLFSGMTSNAFRLGTVLACGWFWTRVGGCSVLYRGSSIGTIDFANILAVTDADAEQIGPASYVEHGVCSTYFYVVRRVNSDGSEECTVSAVVKVSINAEGDLASPEPNNIFLTKAEQVDSNKVRLTWYYCPLEQQSSPAFFKVYSDGGAGQIDFENPVAAIRYVGLRFYSYQSDSLGADKYQFCIRAEDAAGTESGSLAPIAIERHTTGPDAIDILGIETV
jgi:hypothetical protein